MPITHHPPVLGATTPLKNAPSPAQPSPPPPRASDTKEAGRDQTRESSQSGHSSSTPTPSHVDRHTPVNVSTADFIRHAPPAAFRPPPDFPPFFTNGNGLFRPGFPGYQHPAHHHPSVLHSPIQPSSLQNGKASKGKWSLRVVWLVVSLKLKIVKLKVCVFISFTFILL